MTRKLGTMLQLVTVLGLTLTAACGAQETSKEQALINQGCSVNQPDPRACDPADTKKTTVCHIPPGNPANAHTICVGNSAVPAHLDHGDFVGTCTCTGDVDAGTGGGGDDAGSGGGGGDDAGGGGGGSGSDGGVIGVIN